MPETTLQNKTRTAGEESFSFRLRIGDILIKQGLVTPEQVEEALDVQKSLPKRLGDILIDLGAISREQLEEVLKNYNATLEEVWGDPSRDIELSDLDQSLAKSFPEKLARLFKVVPIKREENILYVASADLLPVSSLDYIRFATGFTVTVVLTSEDFVESALEYLYGSSSEVLKEIIGEEEEHEAVEVIEDEDVITDSSEADLANQAPVIRLVNYIISDALSKGASDIHMEPYEKRFRVRYRIDGVLHEQIEVPFRLRDAVIARTKILSHMDIVERRLPQDGRAKVRIKGREADLRVSTIPTIFGEKVVLRILEKASLTFDLKLLGFNEKQLAMFNEAIERPYGMVLITGPTGSGKTTTLYSALSKINNPDINIMTIEDPVEYNFEGINQIQTKEDIGLTFAAALRSFLRQDPDVILVGEIRDLETADIAIKAALTGHLVFSTLHTNDAPSTVTRLVDMGVEPFLVSSSVHLVVAQRLARKICKYCKEEYKNPPPELLERLGITMEDGPFYHGRGCSRCNHTGYKGRIAFYEIMPVSPAIGKLIVQKASADRVFDQALEEGLVTLRQSGIEKMKEGITSPEEVLRVTV